MIRCRNLFYRDDLDYFSDRVAIYGFSSWLSEYTFVILLRLGNLWENLGVYRLCKPTPSLARHGKTMDAVIRLLLATFIFVMNERSASTFLLILSSFQSHCLFIWFPCKLCISSPQRVKELGGKRDQGKSFCALCSRIATAWPEASRNINLMELQI